MIKLKLPQKILEITCNDTQFAVQEAALNVLRIMCQHEQAKKVLLFITVRVNFGIKQFLL